MASTGGGVFAADAVNTLFSKTGGTIYGDEDHVYTGPSDPENTATTSGNAIYLNGLSGTPKNNDSGSGDTLYAGYDGSAWDLGATGPNW
jgi:hypothetical protein